MAAPKPPTADDEALARALQAQEEADARNAAAPSSRWGSAYAAFSGGQPYTAPPAAAPPPPGVAGGSGGGSSGTPAAGGAHMSDAALAAALQQQEMMSAVQPRQVQAAGGVRNWGAPAAPTVARAVHAPQQHHLGATPLPPYAVYAPPTGPVDHSEGDPEFAGYHGPMLVDPVWGPFKPKDGAAFGPCEMMSINCCPCCVQPTCGVARQSAWRRLAGSVSFGLFVIQFILLIASLCFRGFAPTSVNSMLGPWPDTLDVLQAKNAARIVYQTALWRLVTPIFLHAGVIHFAFNMSMQMRSGLRHEYEWGTLPYIVIYVASGIMGNVYSSVISTGNLSVGASGALIGVFGAWFTHTIATWHEGSEERRAQRMSAFIQGLLNIFVMVAFSFIPLVDWAAHLFGFIGGALMGLWYFGHRFATPRGVDYVHPTHHALPVAALAPQPPQYGTRATAATVVAAPQPTRPAAGQRVTGVHTLGSYGSSTGSSASADAAPTTATRTAAPAAAAASRFPGAGHRLDGSGGGSAPAPAAAAGHGHVAAPHVLAAPMPTPAGGSRFGALCACCAADRSASRALGSGSTATRVAAAFCGGLFLPLLFPSYWAAGLAAALKSCILPSSLSWRVRAATYAGVILYCLVLLAGLLDLFFNTTPNRGLLDICGSEQRAYPDRNFNC